MFEATPEDGLYISRLDTDQLLGITSRHSFQLEDRIWPTVEHYFLAMQFEDETRQEAIRLEDDPVKARKMGKTGWFRRPRPDWDRLQRVYMTRAVYTKCKSYPEVADALLATGDERIVENDQYNYYWGLGRDRRGDNTYGSVLMEIRDKLREELANGG